MTQGGALGTPHSDEANELLRARSAETDSLATVFPRRGALAQGLWAEVASDGTEATASKRNRAVPTRPRSVESPGRSRLRAVVSSAPFRGRYARARVPHRRLTDVAWDATLRAAVTRQPHAQGACRRLKLTPRDLLVKQRVRPPAQLLLFVVDISGSMAGDLMRYARRMATTALTDAYLKRASVAMIVFRERSAELLLGPTRKVERVHRALDRLPLGGTTPLAPALELARSTLQRQLVRDGTTRPTLVLISDGRANVGSRPGYEGVVAEVEARARAIADMSAVRVLFLDTTEAGKDERRARTLGRWLRAERVSLAIETAAGRGAAVLAQLAASDWRRR